MLCKTYGGCTIGIDAICITVETSIEKGVNFMMVGLPDNAVKESHHRIVAALEYLGYKFPIRKVVINLSPANIRKEGSAYDLTIAAGVLSASGQICPDQIDQYLIMGELSLDGSVQKIKGALPIALEAKKQGFKGFILPLENAEEASVVKGIDILGIKNIQELIDFFNDDKDIVPTRCRFDEFFKDTHIQYPYDFCEVKGQENAKRALEITAAGGHNLLLIGPPGSGKTMLAKRLPGILPSLSMEEAMETTKIHSVAGKLAASTPLIGSRPFRSPHHTLSYTALAGGGSYPQPGELSLAHNGVLFLDELPEFSRHTLEVLRQPLEERRIHIARSQFHVEYPASIMLIASMNPCPCGFYNHPDIACVCKSGSIQKYIHKISGPLLDRIDIHLEVAPVEYGKLESKQEGEKSEFIRQRVIRAREIQSERFKNDSFYCNAQMTEKSVYTHCKLDSGGRKLLKTAMQSFHLSARAYHRILKVARSIADIEVSENIREKDIAEAIHFRCLDKSNWGH